MTLFVVDTNLGIGNDDVEKPVVGPEVNLTTVLGNSRPIGVVAIGDEWPVEFVTLFG
ncbi:hypothetical protein rerp_12300 [Rhodococcus erythropolis]|nr:hypothetical protein rerp_12300 [Rhodococcus erythropolis]